jgi:hypothetical protein
MNVISALTLAISIVSMISCADGSSDTFSTTPSNVNTSVNDGGTGNNTAPVSVTNKTNNSATALNDVTATALNPPHGKPGHRCDIPVGQPLNNQPAKRFFFDPLNIRNKSGTTTPPAPPPPNRVNNSATNGTAFQPADGLNPPHGQPGHRCDITVGQPLNSKPPAATPVTNTVAVAPGMNPPHGQPGHRCDIAVGQPLNSKPPQKTTRANATDSSNVAKD